MTEVMRSRKKKILTKWLRLIKPFHISDGDT